MNLKNWFKKQRGLVNVEYQEFGLIGNMKGNPITKRVVEVDIIETKNNMTKVRWHDSTMRRCFPEWLPTDQISFLDETPNSKSNS